MHMREHTHTNTHTLGHALTCTEISMKVMMSWDPGLMNLGGETATLPCSKIR